MPDILIRGMEMPKNCGGCYLNHGEFCFMLCRKLNIPQEWEARPSNCPLVELPAHGDLIEAEHLAETLDYYIREAGWGDEINKALGWVRDDFIKGEAVIVPASEEATNDPKP